MASNTPIATVSAMSGQVFVRNSEGELRQLQVGDVLTEGDVLVPSEGAFVQLAMTDGTYMSFDQPVEVAITENMVSGDEETVAENESISDESVAAVLAAIEAGQDPTDVLPAPAAGGAGPGGGEGHDFVLLTRIVETTDPSVFHGQTFAASDSPFISPDLLPVDEPQPPVAVDDAVSLDEDSSVIINILGNDSDPDGDLDPTSVVIITQPSNGVISVDPVSGAVTYTPDENYNGPDSFEYTVSDEAGNTSDPATVSITVNPVNEAPFATDNDYSVDEGGQVSGNIIADNTGDGIDSDIDNDPLMIATINGQPVVFDQQDQAQIAVGDGILTINKDGSYTYQHNGEEPEETSFTYTVTDGDLESNSATVTLNVQQVNDAPVATDNDYDVDEGGQIGGNIITNDTGDGADSDPENDSLTIMDVNGQPVVFNQQGEAQISIGDGTLTLNEDGTFTYVHDGSEPAPTSFTYTVSDGNLESNTATVTLNVQQVNDAPVATDNDYDVNEGGQVVGNIITNNTGDGADSDPENDPLTIMDVNGQPVVFNQQGEAQISIGDGTLTINEDGTFTYVHDGSEPAPTSFTYTVSDGNLESNTATVTLNVQQVNDAPVATDNDYDVNEGGQVVGNIITNNTGDGVDSDPENDSLTIMDVNGQPVVFNQQGEAQISIGDGTLTLNEDGTFTYVHDGSEPAPTSFTYTVSDGNLESNTATVTLNVQQVNDAPVATDNDYNVNEGGQVGGNIITNNTGDGVDSDPENDSLTIMDVNGQPVVFNQQGEAQISIGDGTLTLNEDGTFTYVHDGSEPAPTSFTYTVSDGNLESNTATVTLNVQQVNDAPVATDNDYDVNEGGQVVGNIITNNTGDGADSDPENDPLTIMDVNGQPVVFNQQGEVQISIGDGTLTLNEDGTFTYVHDGSEPAPTSFTYTVSDGNLESNTATVTLNVQQVNDAPMATDNDYNVNEGGQVSGNIITNNTGDGADSDPENDPLTIMDVNGQPVVFNQQGEAQISIGDGTLTLNEDGTFTYVHDGSEPAPTSFTYTVSDGNLESNTATVTFSVQSVDEPVTLDMTGSAGTVYDVGLLSDTDNSETTNGSFKVNAPDGLASVTIAGNILLVADLMAATELMPLTVFSDANEEMVITGYDANTGTISYSYSLITAVTHDIFSDQTMTSFEVIAEDLDGSVSDPGFIVITQNDDVPEIISVADGMGANGSLTIVGTLSVDPSADSPQSFSWGEFNPSQTLYVNGEPLSYSQDNQTQTITGMLEDGTVVFTLTVNEDMNSYTYTQYFPIQTEATDVLIGMGLSGGNSDNFRLSSSGLASDPIQTIFYGYEFDEDTNEYTLSTVNTSANTMGVGDGQDVDADSGQEDHLFMNFDQNVTEISLGIDTNGNSVATLRYTVYTVMPAELALLGQDGFTYDALPAGGVTGVIQVTDGDTVTITADQLGLDEFTFIVFSSDDGEYKIIPDELTVNYLSENQDFTLTAPFNVIDNDFDFANDSIVIDVSGTLDTLTGTGAQDALGGNEEANTLIGGPGDDILTGGLGSDTFVWNLNDGGSPGDPAADIITDFDTALPGNDGDVLDLSDLLVDEQNNDLTDYLYFDLNNDGDTVIHISTVAGFDSGFDNGVVEQTIELSGVDLVSAFTDLNGTDQAALIQDLVNNGKLITD